MLQFVLKKSVLIFYLQMLKLFWSCHTRLITPKCFIVFYFTDQMARQEDVHQAGDHNCDSKYPKGGQERKDQRNIPNHI